MDRRRRAGTLGLAYFADVDPIAIDDTSPTPRRYRTAAGCTRTRASWPKAAPRAASGDVAPAELFALGRALGPLSTFAAPAIVKRMVDHAQAQGLSIDDSAASFKTIV